MKSVKCVGTIKKKELIERTDTDRINEIEFFLARHLGWILAINLNRESPTFRDRIDNWIDGEFGTEVGPSQLFYLTK